MTEAEWLLCRDPLTMLDFLRSCGAASDRQLRLFGVACSRRVWDRLDDLGRAAVELAEQFADGLTGPEELRAARLACKSAGESAAWYAAASSPVVAARNAVLSAQSAPHSSQECAVQADLLRDIVGNPFRAPPAVEPAWKDGRVISLAGAIYEERDFSSARMRLLADALEQAGCGDEELLGHCRRQGIHCRGCFVVDLLRG